MFGRSEGVGSKAAAAMAVADICKVSISQAIYFIWKKKYDGPLRTKMRRLKQLEQENASCARSSPI
jgi:hypothetical protein